MPSLSRILLPIDFSDRSVGAARCVRALVKHFSSEVILLHALAPLDYQLGGAEMAGVLLADVYRNQADHAARELEQFREKELAPCRARCLVREGDPASQIVEFAHAEKVDLIVMPTHGYGPFRRFILGSNTAKVLHDAECPVWTGVHLEGAPVAPFAPFRSLVCAVDLGPQSRALIEWAATFQKEFGARLTLAHAITPPSTDIDSAPAWLRRAQQSAEEELSRLAEEAGAFAELAVAPGEPEQVINSVVLRAGGELLIIGRGSAAGSFGRLRKHAYTLIRQSACPVVSV